MSQKRYRIRELCESRGWDIMQLSRRSDINYQTAANLFKDDGGPQKTDTLEKVASALGVEVWHLFAGAPDPQSAYQRQET